MADERDPKVSQRYLELGAEEPSRELDERILAASRRRTTGRSRWYAPVAVAAALVLAVAVTLQVEREKTDEAVVASAPPAEKETTVETPPAAAEAQKPRAAEQRKQFVPEPPARAPAAAPPPAPAPSPSAEASRDLAKQNEAAGARSDSAAAPAAAQARREQQAAPQAAPAVSGNALGQFALRVDTPDAWLERIAELRKQGKDQEADKALAEFRKRYPDYRLTDEMKAKVEKK